MKSDCEKKEDATDFHSYPYRGKMFVICSLMSIESEKPTYPRVTANPRTWVTVMSAYLKSVSLISKCKVNKSVVRPTCMSILNSEDSV